MVKQSYKIPHSLTDNYLDMEIALQSKDGVGLRPLPIKVIMFWLFSFFALFYLIFNDKSWITEGGTLVTILFAITWLALTYVLASFDKSRRMQVQLIAPLLSYMPKVNRYVMTRKTSNANPFYGIVNIKKIDEKTGLVEYTDGTFAYWYAVVGSASVLLFPEDRDAILNRVDDFYRKISADCEIAFMTTKESQNVVRQKAHLIAQYKALEYKDPDIDKLVKEQYNILDTYVGGQFKSIHQYMMVKGDNREALTQINNVVVSEYENSSMMLKQCIPLYKDDIESVLRTVYTEGN